MFSIDTELDEIRSVTNNNIHESAAIVEMFRCTLGNDSVILEDGENKSKSFSDKLKDCISKIIKKIKEFIDYFREKIEKWKTEKQLKAKIKEIEAKLAANPNALIDKEDYDPTKQRDILERSCDLLDAEIKQFFYRFKDRGYCTITDVARFKQRTDKIIQEHNDRIGTLHKERYPLKRLLEVTREQLDDCHNKGMFKTLEKWQERYSNLLKSVEKITVIKDEYDKKSEYDQVHGVSAIGSILNNIITFVKNNVATVISLILTAIAVVASGGSLFLTASAAATAGSSIAAAVANNPAALSGISVAANNGNNLVKNVREPIKEMNEKRKIHEINIKQRDVDKGGWKS